MNKLLSTLADLPAFMAWIIFLVENVILTCIVLYAGHVLQRRERDSATRYVYTRHEWLTCAVTNILNTVVTYAGFWLWKQQIIIMDVDISWRILPNLLLLFFAMDLLMYLFHLLIHKSILYKAVHQLHHKAIDPKPIDLFILHPVETISFGAMWLVLLVLYPFNMYATLIYLTMNLIFGLVGHLGMEPLPARVRNVSAIQLLGTSTFHHNHHKDMGQAVWYFAPVNKSRSMLLPKSRFFLLLSADYSWPSCC
jgi:lathosterol oxidase